MTGPPIREIHNAKARKSSAGTRKKGRQRRKLENTLATHEDGEDPNATILVPKSKDLKEKEKRERMMQEFAEQSESKWTSKKKKRLEKYIDKKLKKEERIVLFQKLVKTQASMESSVLQSSSTLGTGKTLTHEELQEKVEDKFVRKRLLKDNGKRKRRVENSDDEDTQEEDSNPPLPGYSTRKGVVEIASPVDLLETEINPPSTSGEAMVTETPSIGSALQRNTDGSFVTPRVGQKSKRKKMSSWGRGVVVREVESQSDTSFDSSDSEGDSLAHDASEEEKEHEDSEADVDTVLVEEDSEDLNSSKKPPQSKRSLGFKDWATKQLNAAKGYTPSESSVIVPAENESTPLPPRKKRKIVTGQKIEMRGPLGEDLPLPSTSFAQHILQKVNASRDGQATAKVEVRRLPEVNEARILLPIVTEEQPIMEAVWLNPVVIICGETGSGKTTQVPQFLYEAGFGAPGSENPGMIGITQPRRVAAVSMANRVAHELSLSSSRVSYQIRYDATVSPTTSIKFMTDGVLLRELATDFLLTRYSVIIIDEAHERNINTDILIGVLSRVIKLREDQWKQQKDGIKPLRLIIMSATLRVSDFAENRALFAVPPPIINVSARQYPVTVHFSRRTYPDYVTQAIKKAVKIHTRLPPGGILIFLTGQNEITGVCRRLGARFGAKAIKGKRGKHSFNPLNSMDDSSLMPEPSLMARQAPIEVEDIGIEKPQEELAIDVDENTGDEDPEALESDDDGEINKELGLEDDSDVPMHILPLYSLLPNEKQMQVFQSPPVGSRLVIVSTNVAETSLTIPGIRYVVDCGRAKERHYDVSSRIQAFQVSWISKASAAQRSGRAGRTGPGHCYRLYSSALYEHHFAKFAIPEIQRMPIDSVILQMKSMHIDAVVNFPFPTAPDRQALHNAEKILRYLGALTSVPHSNTGAQITDLGRAMSLFPLSPRLSRMLVTGQQHGCLPYVICIVSALSVGDPFVYEENLEKEDGDSEKEDSALSNLRSDGIKAKEARRLLRKAFHESQHVHASLGKRCSDMFRLLSVIGAYEYAGGGQPFCLQHFVRPKAMEEIHKLRAQISNLVQTNFPGSNPDFTPTLPPPDEKQLKALRQILTAGFIDQTAVRKDLVEKHTSGNQYTTSKGVPYRALGIGEDVYIHPSSILSDSLPPEYVVFSDVVRTSRVFIKGLTIVNPAWLSSLGKNTLCTFSKPTKNNVGVYMTIPKFGPDSWELPAVKVVGELSLSSSSN
ncbi:P-loop containing nucleoside triphosphate hydrolase protein [Crepidotus variabilis]|uniref:RNA helicase n=1 Tax=Crepidotus variabilis TaxID=179855 RepID=A0A9P6EQY9_9AGAR|nr:P-loop containing nucleoside triphosphate hydrolase protein [Crepidotus variabilis]